MPEPSAREFEHKHVVTRYLVFVVCFMAFGSMTYGASASIISTTLGQPSFYNYMDLSEGQKYYSQQNSLLEAANSIFYAGGIFGPFMHGWLADAYGRKMSIFVACMINLVSQAFQAGSVHIGMFIAFRFFAGWGAFQAVASVPLYIAEIVPPRDRGKLVDIHAIGINVAYVVTGYIGLGFYFLDTPTAWRGPLALTTLPPLIICLFIYWFPESPRYLLSKGRDAEAWSVVEKLHTDPSDPSNQFAKREFYKMLKQIELDRALKASYKEIFTRPSYRKRAIITMTLLFCVMSSGILVIQNYGVIIFARLGYNNVQQLLFQTGYTANALLWSTIAMTFVDLVPRNRLIGTGYAMCGFFLTMLTILLSQFENSTNRAALGACVAMIFLYNVSFELGLDGPEFFYQAEIWPSHLRARGYAIATCVYSGINIPWLQAAPTAFANIGYNYYIIFIVCSAFGALMAFFVFPDTLHKPLEEVAALFGDRELVVLYQQELEGAGVETTLDHIEASIAGIKAGEPSKAEKMDIVQADSV
ncbi:hypothetical protein M409DRAFT_69644 [Zasmidium cellare ATCC 36951]|uniref:Major facilitator superfamily (MFS) profile domain-containing protein n=1 Tax=Zasmidium cellare ATCC 36951 TaxID=1080233 RepID=A0A6A6C396_ZASCE|nr:uncharacterized protein M409DRAFT_69644 [Zasmidium cellare ATCC 36951]KAF2161521.1 hypothetical protein M409DRAFT_69644 [Zasmidium cellare ATCC 36951]